MSLFSSRLFYDAMYRIGAPWEGAARSELVGLVEAGRLQPCRAIDLGCGSGANAIFLAEHGFTVVGVDFSPVAIRKAQRKVGSRSGAIRFVRADLTAPSLGEAEGEYDLLSTTARSMTTPATPVLRWSAPSTASRPPARAFCCGVSTVPMMSCRESPSPDRRDSHRLSRPARWSASSAQPSRSNGSPSRAWVAAPRAS